MHQIHSKVYEITTTYESTLNWTVLLKQRT